jgi:uncharacterized membrane protein
VSTPGPVLPSREDPIVRAASEAVGGPAGRRVRPGTSWWTPVRVALAVATVVFALGVLERGYCRDIAWPRENGQQFAHACYSDVPHLFRERGFAQGDRPYLDTGDHPPLEYPVLTGLVIWGSAEIARQLAAPRRGVDAVNAEAVRFYDVTALLLGVAALVTVAAVAKLAGPRPWDAVMVAAAPVLALSGTINWDLAAVALSTLSLLAWARRRPGLAGFLLGLAVAAKLYPVVLLFPLFLVCWRAGRLAAWRTTTAMTVVAWVLVNAPVMIVAPQGWKAFYEFNQRRPADFGSVWYVLQHSGHGVPALNLVVAVLLVVAFLGIGVLARRAPVRPRLPQLAFLAVAAFVVLNKVWSPQYALWLLPLAVLARPRWRDFLIWQAAEVAYFFAVWYFLLGGYDADHALPPDVYYVAVLLRLAATLWLILVVVRDLLHPARDPVRAIGVDDPAGGVVDGVSDPAPRHRRMEIHA